jgi:hypothetical protein
MMTAQAILDYNARLQDEQDKANALWRWWETYGRMASTRGDTGSILGHYIPTFPAWKWGGLSTAGVIPGTEQASGSFAPVSDRRSIADIMGNRKMGQAEREYGLTSSGLDQDMVRRALYPGSRYL